MDAPLAGRFRFSVSGLRATAPDGVEIAFDVSGTGLPAVVLVHGWSCDRSYWQAQVEALSQRHQVVTLDLAGHGESGLGRTDWSIQQFARDVVAVVGQVGPAELVLVGHSMGGDVVLEAARLLPGRVSGIVWVDTYNQLAQFSSPDEVRARMAPFEADFVQTTGAFVRRLFPASADPELVERVAADMAAAPPQVALPAMQSAWTFGAHVPALLRSVRAPVVAINPEQPPSDLDSMNAHGVTVESIAGVGHFLMMERPQRFNECLESVLASFQTREGRAPMRR